MGYDWEKGITIFDGTSWHLKMKQNTKPRQFIRLVQREAAEQYLSLTLLSFAASVTLTRLFLSLTGYPQLGSGELHIAHVLWGGLLLYAAALLPLLFANRGIYSVAALLAGTGVGLFIDEVGKFITQSNDYFYPVAAAIIYIFFLLTLLLFLQIRRAARAQGRDELAGILEDIREALHQPLTPGEYERMTASLETVVNSAPSKKISELARALLEFLETEAPPEPFAQRNKSPMLARRILARVLSDQFLRASLVVGVSAMGLLSLKNPLSMLLASRLPPQLSALLGSLYVGRHIEAIASPFWSAIRLGLEVTVGAMLLGSAWLLAVKRDRLGTAMANLALLLSLTTVNILLFYFEQFSTIITAAIQFLLLIGIYLYRRRIE